MRFSDLASVASALTISRLVMAGGLPFLPNEWLLYGYVIALLTDVIDGPVARRTGRVTPAGASLDAWADKALHVNLAWHFVVLGWMPGWWMLAWFAREIVQLPMIPVLLRRWRTLQCAPETTNLGRLTTITLAVATFAVLLGLASLPLTLLVGVAGVVAGVDYGRIHLRPFVPPAVSARPEP